MNGVAAVVYRDYCQRLTNIAFVFWDLLAPMAYLLLFGLGFDRTIRAVSLDGVEVGYAEFFLAGVLAMTTYGIEGQDRAFARSFSDHSQPVTGREDLFQCAAERRRLFADDTAGRRHAADLDPMALDSRHAGYGDVDDRRVVFPVQRVGDPVVPDGYVQYLDQCGLPCPDVSEQHVLPGRSTARVVQGSGLGESDDLAGRCTAIQLAGNWITVHCAS